MTTKNEDKLMEIYLTLFSMEPAIPCHVMSQNLLFFMACSYCCSACFALIARDFSTQATCTPISQTVLKLCILYA